VRAPSLVFVLAQLAGSAQHPWAAPLDALRAGRDDDARVTLEALGRAASLDGETRAHAWSWAGQIASRRGALDAARRDFTEARRVAPTSYDARMAAVHLGEVEARAGHWRDAERALVTVERDADPVIAAYAGARLRGVRERLRRRALRVADGLAVVGAALALARRVWRTPGDARRRVGRSFGRALLVTWSLAIVGAAVAARRVTSLAASATVTFAIVASVAVAMLWATRREATPRRHTALTLVVTGVALAAGLHLALDLMWRSVVDPLR
jgi:hypothetical protein